MKQHLQPEGRAMPLPRSRRPQDVEALRRRDRQERQRPLWVALCLALAVAGITGAGLLREIWRPGAAAAFDRGPGPRH